LSDESAVAVVGLAGRWPGARDAGEFWDNLRQGVESISRFTREEMRAAGADPALLDDPRWVPAGGVLEEADRFDAPFFHFTPREAELLDPQHRLFLECAWEALEDAGCDPGRFAGAIGVFGGTSLNTYLLHNLLPAGDTPANPQVAIASDKDFLTTRVSYKLNLTGPSLDVQTACSTSLVAVVLACQSLLNYQCDLALAGGVSAREPQRAGYLHQEQGILSPDGHCRPFDAKAAGTVPGNGVGMVALKRLEDALAAGDPIRAVIRGAALNNDGAGKVGYTAPGVSGQAEVVALALAVAGVKPEEIGYVEAHGTATPMGDPIEVRALEQAFQGVPPRSCVLGSVKSNLGHLDAAAGITGLIKAVLAVQHGEIPPTLHFERPNPAVDFDGGPFRVSSRLETWKPAEPRKAGVSSFGIGGSNAHVVLEEAPPREPAAAASGQDDAELLLLSARTPTALEAATARLARHLEKHPELRLADVARTLRLGRKPMAVRRALVAASVADAASALADPERWLTGAPPDGERAVVFLFPGQGAQHAGMAAGLYERKPAFRAALDACAQVLEPLGIDLRRLLADGERLAETAAVQPALFAVEYALAQLWMSWGVKPAAVLGHSLGEYVAACIAGVFPLATALRLVVRRGQLLQSTAEGAMLAVPLSAEELRPALAEEVELAAVNAPDRCVVSGPAAAVERLREELAGRGIDARPVPVRRAFHSRSLEPVLDAFVDEVRQARPGVPEIPWLSNLTGGWFTPEQAADPAAWGESLRRPVRFSAAVTELLRDPGRLLLEVGPGRTLAALVRRHGGTAISSLPHPEAPASPREGMLEAAGRLWLAGVEIDWSRAGSAGRLVPLPTYPFERYRYWIERANQQDARTPAARPSAGPVLQAPLWRQTLPATAGDPRAAGAVWLAVTDEGEIGSLVVERLRAERLEPAVAVPGAAFSRLSAGAFTVRPGHVEDYAALLAAVDAGERPLRIVHAGDGASLEALATALRNRNRPVEVEVITSGAATDPERASAVGLCAAAGIAARALDVEPPPDSRTPEGRRWTDRVLAEIAAPFAPGTFTAHWGGRRWREAWEDVVPAPAGARTGPGAAEIARLAQALAAELPAEPAVAAATDPLVTAHAVQLFREAGVDVSPGSQLALPELRRRLRLIPQHEALFGFLLRVLRDDRVIEPGEESVRFLSPVPSPAEVRGSLAARFPGFAPLYDLIDHCGSHYPAALSGEISGLAVLYPEGGSDLFARQERGASPAARLLGQVLASAARERPLRILEVGAGQGTLTAELLPHLAPGGIGHAVEYWFTDVGRAFVLRAEQRARDKGQGFLRFGMLDVTRDPAAQGFAPGSFDAVIGADVVHATPRLAETLANLRSLLAPGGLLGLVETVRSRRWGTLVWGLTEGWWSFEDLEIRQGSPLLGPEAWEELLARCGFAAPRAFAAGESALLVAHRPSGRERPAAAPPLRFVADLGAARACAPAEGGAVLWTADPAAFRYLAALAEGSHGRLALLWEGDGGTDGTLGEAADLLLARGVTAARLAAGRHREEGGERPEAPSPPPVAAIHERPLLRNPYRAPADETERAVAEIWSRALGIERIGALDNFLELGGDSLIGLQVVHAVQARFGLGQRTFSLYEHPTVAAIARFVEGEGGEAEPDPFAERSSRGERRRERSTSLKRMRP
jgi:phthiocerol/phenolphthiocerol synthesis type-I polyketide synthase E